MSFIDKTPLRSKKFIFALIAFITLSALVAFIVFSQTVTWPLASVLVILSLGLIIIPVGYVLGQAAIDKLAAMVKDTSTIFDSK